MLSKTPGPIPIKGILLLAMLGMVILAIALAQDSVVDHRPKLFLSLPDSCNTPDGMALDGAGEPCGCGV